MKFILYAAFASPHEAGFDPTVQRMRVTDEDTVRYNYRYRVRDRESGRVEVYQTVGDPISDSSAYRISSCATRAWEAKKMVLDDDGDPKCDEEGNPTFEEGSFVIRDKWMYVDSVLERDMQTEIFNALGDDAKDARQYFLTVLSEGIVQFGDENPCDDVTPTCGPTTPTYWTIPEVTEITVPQNIEFRQERVSRWSLPPDMPPPPPPYTARMHVRTVFKERCQSVFELTDFRSLFLCLLGCVRGVCASRCMLSRIYLMSITALKYLRQAGFVHRDVSAGNCLYFPGTDSGKLSDLEFAKHYDDIMVNEHKTVSNVILRHACTSLTVGRGRLISWLLSRTWMAGSLDGSANTAYIPNIPVNSSQRTMSPASPSISDYTSCTISNPSIGLIFGSYIIEFRLGPPMSTTGSHKDAVDISIRHYLEREAASVYSSIH